MGIVELIIQMLLLGIGLSMDAFAVSVSNGLSMRKIIIKKAVLIAAMFGVFQALMPLLGYFLGASFADFIQSFDHYLALVFLGFIGSKMAYEGIKELAADKRLKTKGIQKPFEAEKKFTFSSLLLQAVATSIDALVVGVSFVAMKMTVGDVFIGIAIIGVTTFILSLFGVFAGKKFGDLLGSRAEIVGGLILIGIGAKVFIEHVFLC